MSDRYNYAEHTRSREQSQDAATSFLNGVYLWMTLGLALTGATALYVANTEWLVEAIFSNNIAFIGLILAELGLVLFLSARIHTLSPGTASGLFLLYALLNGLTLSLIFLIYTRQSIATAFFVTSATFGAMSIVGFVTRTDLTKLGSLAMMAIIGGIIASIVNWFLASEALYWIITYVLLAAFIGLVAYDTQQIKRLAAGGFADKGQESRATILGALLLYIDFINILLLMLRIFGRRR